MTSMMQHTLGRAITTRGVGLHSGATLTVTLHPAGENTGILFRRTDVAGGPVSIPATALNVVDTRMATVLGAGGVTLSTVEHILAALWSCGVDNAVVDIGGPEVPVMDGSSAPWVALIEDAGVVAQATARTLLRCTRTVEVVDGDKRASLAPASSFQVSCDIDFVHPAIGPQRMTVEVDGPTFRRELARARTFGFLKDVEMLRKMGLAKGGSMENAVVLDDTRILNPEGLRFRDEFVRHKILDAVGDLYLLGAPLLGRLELRKAGHAVHNQLCRALLAQDALERVVATDLRRSISVPSMGAMQARASDSSPPPA